MNKQIESIFNKQNVCVAKDIQRKNNICYLKCQISGIENNHGNTIGNVLRRTILSSTPGLAIYGFSCSVFKHEFDSCHYIQEDANVIMYNLKDVIVVYNEIIEDIVLSFTFHGPIYINAGMFEKDNIKILNTDKHIMHICDNVEIKFSLYIKRSTGFSIHCNNVSEADIANNIIGVTAVYSRIINVDYKTSKDVVNNKLDIVDLTVSYYDVYDYDYFVIHNAIQYCADIYSTLIECLLTCGDVIHEQEDDFQRRKRLMNILNVLKDEFGNEVIMYINSLSFTSITELIDVHFSDVANYKAYGIKKKQYKDLISRLQQLADEDKNSNI